MQKTITFRSQAMGVVHDLIADEGLTCQLSQDLIYRLAGELLHYQEEGVELSPVILFCQDVEGLVGSFPGSIRYAIGQAPLSANSAGQILKDCAPLSTPNWHVFIERRDASTVHYGVFRYLLRPTTLPLHETISAISGQFGLVIRKTSKSGIELHGSKGNSVALLFSTARDDTPANNAVERFCNDCTHDAPDAPGAREFPAYFRQMIDRLLTASHGTILICASPASISSATQLNDHITLEPPLSAYAPFLEYKRTGSADTIIDLQCTEELIQGFMNSDGMVAFDQTGRALAYRVFYKGDATDTKVVGGARRRAFEGVRTLLGTAIISALFRSQDGHMIYAGT